MSTWLDDIIEAYNNLGGEAHYSELYPEVEKIRLKNNASWYDKVENTIQRCVQTHSSDSAGFDPKNKNVLYKDVFYSVNGLSLGTWGLLPQYRIKKIEDENDNITEQSYTEGLEGIVKERTYLTKTRDIKLVEERKRIDNFTCQACGFCLKIKGNHYVIDVHHLNPIGLLDDVSITKVDELICLCPNCHRIAHSRREKPLTVFEIKNLIEKNKNEQN